MPSLRAKRLRHAEPGTMTLLLIAAIGPLSSNFFIPVLPIMAQDLNAEFAVVQLAISIYIFASGALQFVGGPASDRFGRRPVLLVSLTLFLLSSIGVIMAQTVTALLLWRACQAFAAIGIILARAIVNDTCAEAEAMPKLGKITIVVTLIPMISPAFGGFLAEYLGWRALFLIASLVGLVAIMLAAVDLPETNTRRSANMRQQFKSYPALIGSRQFWLLALSTSFNNSAWFAFIGGGAYVATHLMNLNPAQYGATWMFSPAGYIAGNMLMIRLSRQMPAVRIVRIGNLVASLSFGIIALTLWLFPELSLIFFFGAFFIGLSNGLALPTGAIALMNIHRRLAGSAAGLGGAMQFSIGAALAWLAGTIAERTDAVLPLASMIFFLFAIAWVLARFAKVRS